MDSVLEIGVDVFPVKGDGLIIVADDTWDYRVPVLGDISWDAPIHSPLNVCSHVPREVGGWFYRGTKKYVVSWRVAVCEHNRDPLVITTEAREREAHQ